MMHLAEKSSPFLKLAPELRDIIYGYAVVSEYNIYPCAMMSVDPQWRATTINKALFRVNHQVSNETLRVFYARNTVVFCHHKHRQLYYEIPGLWTSKPRSRKQLRKDLIDRFHPLLFHEFANVHIIVDWIFTSRDGDPAWDSRLPELMSMLKSLCKPVFAHEPDKRTLCPQSHATS